ncbi:hypothetical protein Avbf_18669 [Armadillidium vulgare]|nr:hypothetical protein Avbf_18669 [Armadillidium vulgare]
MIKTSSEIIKGTYTRKTTTKILMPIFYALKISLI